MKSVREGKLEKELKNLNKKHHAVLQSARQIFSIAINCLQQLHNIKDVSTPILYKNIDFIICDLSFVI